jgi:N-acetylglucosaminyldiphosphoundecaprenol N-acetyl-beta-D-mannosaminyltransferase
MIFSGDEVRDLAASDFGDLSRPVYGLFGIPIDAVDFVQVVTAIKLAASRRRPFLVSTPNVNFLVASQSDAEFRESLLMSDLCPVDGAPVVVLAKLLGIPVRERVSGSDTFERLKNDASSQLLKVFFFGGTDEAGALLSKSVDRSDSIQCVGRLNPGFGSVDELSQPTTIQKINDSGADLLAVFLSATKAQKWLLVNHTGLKVPVRFDFGGTINFQAGLVGRAPVWMRNSGLEWVWRIKEEPYLWRRYWIDGCRLVSLCLRRVVPLLVVIQLDRRRQPHGLSIVSHEEPARAVVKLSGDAIAAHVHAAIVAFRKVIGYEKHVVFDLSDLSNLDQRFIGLLLMLRKCLKSRGLDLEFTGVKKRIANRFRLNGFTFLLESRQG